MSRPRHFGITAPVRSACIHDGTSSPRRDDADEASAPLWHALSWQNIVAALIAWVIIFGLGVAALFAAGVLAL